MEYENTKYNWQNLGNVIKHEHMQVTSRKFLSSKPNLHTNCQLKP